MIYRVTIFAVWTQILAWTPEVFAQASSDGEDPLKVQTVLDPSPFVSVRAAAMGGALSTLADGVHAPYYNPAGIGGLHWERQRPPRVRQVHFPYVGSGLNKNTQEINQSFQEAGGASDRAVGNAIVEANAGKRQYARASSLFTLGISRTLLMVYNDLQFSAFKSSEASDDGSIKAHYRSVSGGGFGFSVVDRKERFYMGMFQSSDSRKEFKGNFEYLDVVNVGDRTKTLQESSFQSSKKLTNMWMLWILAKTGRPAVAVVVRDYDSTHILSKDEKSEIVGKSEDELTEAEIAMKEQLTIRQDVTIGFSVSPRIGKRSSMNFLVEAQNIQNQQIAINKKYRAAWELNLGGFGSEALFGLRAGVSVAGGSAGMSFNFGLLQFEAAVQSIDLGIGNEIVPEQRFLGVFSVNVLDN